MLSDQDNIIVNSMYRESYNAHLLFIMALILHELNNFTYHVDLASSKTNKKRAHKGEIFVLIKITMDVFDIFLSNTGFGRNKFHT